MKKFNLDIPKIGYVLAVKRKPKDFFGNRIEKAQLAAGYKKKDACYTHVEVLSGGPDSMRITPPRAKAIDITKVYAGCYVKILRYENSYLDYDNRFRYKIALRYNLLCNLKYDYFGVLSFILSFIKHNKNDYFCSEGTCQAFQHFIPDFLDGIDPSKCYPATIVSDKTMITHWQGVIPKDYYASIQNKKTKIT